MEWQDVIDAMGRGQTWCGGIFQPQVRAVKNWCQTQVFAIDVDNNDEVVPLATLVQHYTRLGFPPNGWYFSLSSSDEQPKFRILWVVDDPVTDRDKAVGFNRWLIKNSMGAADSCTIDLARLFFGGKDAYNTGHNFIPYDLLPTIGRKVKKKSTFQKRKYVKDANKLLSAVKYVREAIADPAGSKYITRYRTVFNGAVYLYSASDGVWDEGQIWGFISKCIDKYPEHWADYHHTDEEMEQWVSKAVEWSEENVQ